MKNSIPFFSIFLLIVIVIAAAALLIWQLSSIQPEEPGTGPTTQEQAQANANKEPTNTNVNAEADDGEAAPVPPDSTPHIKIQSNPSNTEFSILVDGKRKQEIEAGVPSEAKIFAITPHALYLGLSPQSNEGYVLYSGPPILYTLNFATNKLTEFLVDGFISDISPDRRTIAYVTTDTEVQPQKVIVLYDLEDGSRQEFLVDLKFTQAGDVLFSPDGKQFAYAAAEGDPLYEKSEVYTVDIASGEQTTLETKVEGYVTVEGWANNTTVDYTVHEVPE